MNEPPPPEVLRRLKPIPTYQGEPASRPHDVVGVSPAGETVRVRILGSAESVVLLFLKADCIGCHDLWRGLDEVRASLPASVGVAVVTRDPGEEDVGVIADLGANSSGVLTVMSSQAFADYSVLGPPFYVVVSGSRVLTEGVPWGLPETLRAVRAVLDPGAGVGADPGAGL